MQKAAHGGYQQPPIGDTHADALYRALEKAHGKRTATYCMQVCRRVWNEAIRHKKLKGVNFFQDGAVCRG